MNNFAYLGEILEISRIFFELNEAAVGQLHALEIFDSITSTNTCLLEKIKSHPISGDVYFAESQAEGKGREGREWYSPPSGNIYCSISWRFDAEEIANLSLAIAVMVINAFKKYGVSETIGVKWPNDLFFSGKKLAGILLERSGKTVVIGIGINIKLPLSNSVLIKNAIDLTSITNQKIERNRLAGILLNELLTQLPVFAKKGITPFLEAWRAHDVLIGKNIHVALANQTYRGKMCGISDNGELLLENTFGNIQAFHCGEASLSV